MTFNLISFILGVAAGGIACAVSAKTLGWFNKQVKSIETKIP
jgi:hypothetical protein